MPIEVLRYNSLMRCFFGLIVVFSGVSVANADLLSYHFNTNNEGWRRGDLDVSQFVVNDLGAATWNSEGYIDANDFSNWAFHLSPILNMSWASASRIEFDYSSASSDAPYPFLIIASSTAAIYQTTAVPADGLFHHYSYDFTPGTWIYADSSTSHLATVGEISTLLNSVQQFGISADQSVGPEYTRLDNVMVVPEPVTTLVLSGGLIGLARRRRAKKD